MIPHAAALADHLSGLSISRAASKHGLTIGQLAGYKYRQNPHKSKAPSQRHSEPRTIEAIPHTTVDPLIAKACQVHNISREEFSDSQSRNATLARRSVWKILHVDLGYNLAKAATATGHLPHAAYRAARESFKTSRKPPSNKQTRPKVSHTSKAVWNSLPTGRVLTITDIVQRTGLKPKQIDATLRGFLRNGLVTREVFQGLTCWARSNPPKTPT